MANNQLWIQRTGERTYVGRSTSGAEVAIGKGPGQFSPGDLLKLAVAGCAAMSSDARFVSALGPEFKLDALVQATYDEKEDRFNDFLVQLVTDLSQLSTEEQLKLNERAQGAIERLCTVGHTLERDPHPPVTVTLHNGTAQ